MSLKTEFGNIDGALTISPGLINFDPAFDILHSKISDWKEKKVKNIIEDPLKYSVTIDINDINTVDFRMLKSEDETY